MELSFSSKSISQNIANALFYNGDCQVFQSDDIDEVREQVARVFKPHKLKMIKNKGTLPASMRHVGKGGVSINQLGYQNEVIIDPDRLDDFFLVQIPVNGTAEIRCGNKKFVSTPEVASLISPTMPLDMTWSADSNQVILRLERERVERHCAQHLHKFQGKAIEFDPEFDLTTPIGRHFLLLLQAMTEALTSPYTSLMNSFALDQLESTLINALIYGQSSNLELDDASSQVAPYFIKRVEEYILTHAAEAVTIECLAEKAGVGVRTLFSGFQRYRNSTPMEYLREIRLEKVHAELISNQYAIKSVTDVALKWGFNHLGRFAIEYKRRYGEAPSATLRFKK